MATHPTKHWRPFYSWLYSASQQRLFSSSCAPKWRKRNSTIPSRVLSTKNISNETCNFEEYFFLYFDNLFFDFSSTALCIYCCLVLLILRCWCNCYLYLKRNFSQIFEVLFIYEFVISCVRILANISKVAYWSLSNYMRIVMKFFETLQQPDLILRNIYGF